MSKLLLMSFTSAVLISFASSVMAAERITTLRTPDGVLVKKNRTVKRLLGGRVAPASWVEKPSVGRLWTCSRQ